MSRVTVALRRAPLPPPFQSHWSRGKDHSDKTGVVVRGTKTYRVIGATVCVAIVALWAIKRTPAASSNSNRRGGAVVGISTIPAGTNEVTAGTVVSWPGRPLSIDVSTHATLSAATMSAIATQAQQAGLKTAVIQQATLEVLDPKSPVGFAIPVSVASLEDDPAGELFGPQVAAALTSHKIVLGERSARLRSATIGSRVTIVSFVDPLLEVPFEVGAIVPDEQAGGAEILIPSTSARFLGMERPARVTVWGDGIENASLAFDKAFGTKYVRRSWTIPSVDAVENTAQIKEEFGEFAIRRRDGSATSTIAIDPEWLAKNIVTVNLPIVGEMKCNRQIVERLTDALNELYDAGIAALIDVPDTRRSGGCFNSREIRAVAGQSGRNLSRHSWGVAIDFNPSATPYGQPPRVDARLVDVMRRHGFAWGGTWAFPDGMHFEFIGEPRVTGPRLPPGTSTTTSTTTTSTTTTSTTTTTTTTTTSTTTIPPSTTAPTTRAESFSTIDTSTSLLDPTSAPNVDGSVNTTLPTTVPKKTGKPGRTTRGRSTSSRPVTTTTLTTVGGDPTTTTPIATTSLVATTVPTPTPELPSTLAASSG